MSVTQAMRFLKNGKVEHSLKEYDHKVKGAEFAAKSLDWPLPAMIKTLVVALSNGKFVLALMPGDIELSLKKLSRVAGAKSARMASEAEAEKVTGYLVGGISPFGTKKKMAVWMHVSIPAHERIGINGGRRGLMAFVDPIAVVDHLKATVSDLGV
jgi:Cys-tRNA(Pro)/Cys-tRNA(Cys) deacylase